MNLTASLSTVTLANNSAAGLGGAAYLQLIQGFVASRSAQLLMSGVQMWGNAAAGGGAVYAQGVSVAVASSAVAGNSASAGTVRGAPGSGFVWGVAALPGRCPVP